MAVIFEGAQVVLPDRVARVSVRVEGSVITGIDVAADGAARVECAGLVLAPALVDVHGDAFERQVMPRPGVGFGMEAAILETDRQLAANGIATAYHALTLSWEPGLRSVTAGRAFLDGLAALAPRLTVENRVQLRWETFCADALPLITRAAAGPLAPSIAFNDHTSMIMRAPHVSLQNRLWEHNPAFAVADPDDPVFRERLKSRAGRSGMAEDEMASAMVSLWDNREHVPDLIAHVAAMGRANGLPMLSHDDTQHETRDFYRGLGVHVAEFPMRVEVAQAAKAAGDWTVFGAPNAARGGSHIGSPDAGEMAVAGLCDILASDYYYPAMLAAVARLSGRMPLAALWKLVSHNPARAMGLADRGEIAPGQRADLVLLDWPEGQVPATRATYVAGRAAYSAMPMAGLRAC